MSVDCNRLQFILTGEYVVSITFFIPGAPVELVAPYADDPEYTEVRPVKPYIDVNMANSNAHAIMKVIAPFTVDFEYGEWKDDVLDTVIQNTLKALNTNHERLTTPTVVDGNFISFGRDVDYVTRRLRDMLELLTVARRYGHSVCYN